MREALFNALSTITRLDFEASSGPGSRMGWNHHGSGTVQVMMDGDDIHFTEAFTLENGTPCHDRKCWRFSDEGIIFRHFRQQQFQDILLFPWPAVRARVADGSPSSAPTRLHARATPTITTDSHPACHDGCQPPAHAAENDAILLTAATPYQCPPDTYDGTLRMDATGLTLALRIVGARKDEHIRYTYRSTA